MGLGFGLLSAQLRPGETDWSSTYDETVRLVGEAERLGFSSVWTTEHHFVDDGYLPSLLVTSAALAAATTTIGIGTGVLLAPLHHPLRLAEDAATVQLLSHGRLTLGLGLGWSRTEYQAFGADFARRGAAMEEVLRILPAAWSGTPVRHHGDVYDLPELAVRPVPSARIPIVVGGGVEAAVRRAARLADGIFSNASTEQLLQQVTWVRDELDRAGRDPATFRILHYSVLLPGPSEPAAIERFADHVWAMTWKYTDMEASAARAGAPPNPPPLPADQRERLFARATFAGTAQQIVDGLHELRARAGVPVELVARSYFPTLALDEQLALMEELATEVAPHV